MPISESAPAGVDAAETSEYAEISQEIARIGLGGVRAVDWNRVVRNAQIIVRERCKNLRIAVYLAYGLYEIRGLRGLGAGFGVLADMCEAFWNDLHPPLRRLRGRILAFEWLVDRVLDALERGDAGGDASDCEFAVAQAQRLVACLGERCPVAGETVDRLVPVLRNKRDARGPAADSSARSGDRAWIERSGSASTSGARADGDDRDDAHRVQTAKRARDQALRELSRSMLRVADELQAEDIADVCAYTLRRTSVWLPIRELPPSVDGRTDLPAPASDLRGAIEAAMTGSDHAGALALCEGAATDSLFWFDAHRVAAEALVSMEHQAAARAVRAQTRALLCRLPGLRDLRFRDGTPFADSATRQWLERAADRTVEQECRPAPDSGDSGARPGVGTAKSSGTDA